MAETVHTTPVSFRRRSALIAVGQGTVKASQVAIAIALVRLLSPDQWTAVALALSVYLAAVTLGSLNVQQSLLFFLPRLETAHHRRLVLRTAGVMATMGAVVAGAVVVIDPFAPAGSTGLSSIAAFVALAVAIEIPTAAGPAALLSIDRLAGAAGWDIVGTVALVACVVAPAALGWGPRGVAQGLVVAAAIKAVMFLTVVSRRFPRSSGRLPRGLLTRQLGYGIPLGLTIGASVLNRSVDKWFVALFDHEHLGVYAVAAQEIPLLAVLPYAGGASVVTMLVDAFKRDDRDYARALWLRQTGEMSALVVPLSAALVLIAPELISLVFTADYAGGVVPFQLFTVITIHRVAEYGMVLRAADRTRDLLLSALVLLGANIVFAGVGAWGWGMVGASLGTVLANAVAWLFVLRRVAQAFGSSLTQSFAWRAWSSSVLIATFAAALAAVTAAAVTAAPQLSMLVKLSVFTGVVVGATRGYRHRALPCTTLGVPASRRLGGTAVVTELSARPTVHTAATRVDRSRWRSVGPGPMRRLLCFHALGQAGDAIIAVSLAQVVVFEIGHGASPGTVARVMVIAMLPYLVASSIAAHMSDRWPRRRSLACLAAARTIVAGAACLVPLAQSEVAGYCVWALSLGAAGIASNLSSAGLASVAPGDSLVAANSLAAICQRVAGATGVLLSTLLGLMSPSVALVAAVSLHVAATVGYASTGLDLGGGRPQGHGRARRQPRRIRMTGAPGLQRFVVSAVVHRAISTVVFVTFVLTIDARYELEASGFAVALGLVAVGTVVGTLAAPVIDTLFHRRHIIVGSFLIAAVFSACAAVRTEPWVVVITMIGIALILQVVRLTASSTVQRHTHHEHVGMALARYDRLSNVAYASGAVTAIAVIPIGASSAFSSVTVAYAAALMLLARRGASSPSTDQLWSAP